VSVLLYRYDVTDTSPGGRFARGWVAEEGVSRMTCMWPVPSHTLVLDKTSNLAALIKFAEPNISSRAFKTVFTVAQT
jgi:hypothetical protein